MTKVHLHHTLRQDLIKDILVWSGTFFSILGFIFMLTIGSLSDYMLSKMANSRMIYQVEEFAKHLSENDLKSIGEESDALIHDNALTGMIVIDSLGIIAHISLYEKELLPFSISSKMNITEIRKVINDESYLRLYESAIPGHDAILAIIMDSRPVLKAIYTSAIWTVLLLLTLVGLSVLALHYSLKRHLIKPIDEMKHIIDDDLPSEEKEYIISHLPDEVASLAHSYEGAHKVQEYAEEKLRESEFFLKETQRVAELGTYTLTTLTGAWSSSNILDDIFGIDGSYTRDVQGWLSLIHPDDQKDLNTYLAENVLINHELFNREYRIIRADNGAERWVHGLGKLELNANKKPVKMIGTIQDVTDRKILEQQLNQSQKMEALGNLVGGIAHDFNNILAGIVGNTYLAKKSAQEDSKLLRKVLNIEKLSFRAASLIDQLLIFARKDIVKMKPLLLSPLIIEVIELLRASMPERIEIHQEICHEALQVSGDSTQLHQVVMNLANNAQDAVQGIDSPYISIKLDSFETDSAFLKKHEYFELGSYAHLKVSDNGCGISEKQKKHIFEPFYTTKEQGQGTGLGLAMAFGSIKTHGGFVEVESEEGKGSTFHVYMPLLEKEEAVGIIKRIGDISKGSVETILLVDDDDQLLDIGQEVLVSMGYQVLRASNGIEAVNVFVANQKEISLIIMDVVMPKLGGVEAVERIKKIQPDVKVIFATGYDMGAIQKDIMSTSHSTVISKPYDIENLKKIISEKLRS